MKKIIIFIGFILMALTIFLVCILVCSILLWFIAIIGKDILHIINL